MTYLPISIGAVGDAPHQRERPLAEAAPIMIGQRRRILPVVDGAGPLVGALDRADLLRASTDALGDLAHDVPAEDED